MNKNLQDQINQVRRELTAHSNKLESIRNLLLDTDTKGFAAWPKMKHQNQIDELQSAIAKIDAARTTLFNIVD